MICNVNIDQEENKRTIRISTYVSKETSDLLDEIIIKMKKKEKRKPKINEILERAIKKLYEEIETPQ